MVDISKLSSKYDVRRLNDLHIDSIFEICKGNKLFYEYCEAEPTKEQVLHDLHITPPGKELSDKYYVGFYQKDILIAVMDLIDGYPKQDMLLRRIPSLKLRSYGVNTIKVATNYCKTVSSSSKIFRKIGFL